MIKPLNAKAAVKFLSSPSVRVIKFALICQIKKEHFPSSEFNGAHWERS